MNYRESMISEYFPTLIYQGHLPRSGDLNRELRREIQILAKIDADGRGWSKRNYRGGYSSYASMTQLHRTSPNFGELEERLRPHVKKMIRKLEWDLMEKSISMTTCWANRMSKGTHHTMHLHPHCALSGVYFVDCPPGSSPFKIEDPRMGRLMASPPKKTSARRQNRNYVEIHPKPGQFILFESWLKHEVPPHWGASPRLSIAFNYEWI